IWGADHHGQVKSLQVGLELLGFPPGEPEIILGQLVRIERGGELVRLSRRAGNIITLADILDEVDPDVCRLTFLLQSIDTPQTFDLDVVTSQSMENPVYYVQYAHARIASIGRKASERGVTRRPHPGPPLAVGSLPDRSRRRARAARSLGPRRDGPARRGRGAVTDPGAPLDRALVPPALQDVDAIDALAADLGTPLFVYDEDDLRRRCREYAGL